MERSEVLPEESLEVLPQQRPEARVEAPTDDVTADAPVDDVADNVYGTLLGAPSPADTMVRLRRLGWSVQKASWLEFCCAVDWCELLLTPVEDDELTASGVVDPERLDDLAEALAAAGLTGHLELYDDAGRLTRTARVGRP